MKSPCETSERFLGLDCGLNPKNGIPPSSLGASEQEQGQERQNYSLGLWGPAILALPYSFPQNPQQGGATSGRGPWALGSQDWFLPYFGTLKRHHRPLALYICWGAGWGGVGQDKQGGQPCFT